MTPTPQTGAETRFRMSKQNARAALETAIAEKKIDPLMIPISNTIAKTNHYFTTSTCSGRITLMELEENDKKRVGAFHRKWHSPARLADVWEGIESYAGKRSVWLKQDAFVFVIGTDTLAHAKEIFRICQASGIKRFGIHHFEDGKVLLEVFGTQSMSVPVIINGTRIVEKEYVKKLVTIANRKWNQNDKKLTEFNRALGRGLD